MLRFVLALVLASFIGMIGYYFVQASSAESRAFVPPAAAEEGSRARTTDPELPAPPDVAEEVRRSSPAVPDTTESEMASPPTDLLRRSIGLPIAGLRPTDMHDSYSESRGDGERTHEAIDIMAPRGTPVRAVDDGVIRKLFTSVQGGITIYQFDPAEQYVYYYAHLDRYDDALREGRKVERGDIIGYVGSTGNADPDAPHLHFAILEMGPEKNWGQGNRAINPYPVLMSALVDREARR